MSISSLLTRIAMGRRALKQQREIEQKLAVERVALSVRQGEVRACVRQNEQMSNSASRILDTMTNAMIFMEGNSGKPKK